jgi:dihydrofolate reductase
MGKIGVHEFIALDGVFEDPSWTFEYGFDPQMGEAIGAMTDRSDAILLGRTTYEMFAPAWSTRTVEDDPGAPFFNDTHKYVVGANEPSEKWEPSTRLGPYDPDVIRDLKEKSDHIFVSGSGQLVRGMLADGLVDELMLCVFPVALGRGEKLFGEGADATKLALKDSFACENGVMVLTYGAA